MVIWEYVKRIIEFYFYWPGLKQDVAKWCKECHTCQLGGKPNQNIPQAPSHPIPAFNEPFSHIIIDCVGPLPKTKTQNEYLLTIMCSSTRFPEAIPLRSIKRNAILRPLFFENLFNEPADSRFPKIRIKIKIGFRVFLFAPIRNSSPHFILCDAFANGGQ